MLKVAFCLRFLLFFAALPLSAELLYRLDFNDPEVKKAIARCPFAEVSADFENTQVLTVRVPPDRKDEPPERTAVWIPLDPKRIGAAGSVIEVGGDVKFTGVSRPKFYYNGVKFMMAYRRDGRMYHPAFLPGDVSRSVTSGTRDWFHTSRTTPLAENAAGVRLVLGLQDSSGEASFRNIAVYRAGKAPVSTLKLPEIPKARYTRDIPVRRGVMSPKPSHGPREEDFAELAKWNANLIRWQLYLPKSESLAVYRERVAGALDDVQKALELSQKYGLKLVIDLHPSPNLGLVMGTPEGREFLKEFWRGAVKRYRNHPALWGYDILNEPHARVLGPGDPSWPRIAEELIRLIRELDPETPIIVEAENMAAPQSLEYLPVFDYPNIYYSIHMYIPGELTHQLDRRAGVFHGYPSPAWNKEYLRGWLERTREFQRKSGARIFVGEFGCVRWAPGAGRYLSDLIELFEEYGWDWCYHAFREWDGWSAEHGDDPASAEPVPVSARREVLLKAFSKNGKE
ncbi:MAG: cellulase family glycosylhydrolase [Lentisphaeria bacterium]|nr:cellulase family glycosylhydrolase [Lentisphaeria bacterium]